MSIKAREENQQLRERMLKAIFSFSRKKTPTLPTSILQASTLIRSLIENKQIKELCSHLQRNEDRAFCFEVFFLLSPSISDDRYLGEVFDTMVKKSRMKSSEISTILSKQLSSAILQKNFDQLEKILHLPYPSVPITLSTFELIKLIENCPDSNQVIRCLSILIEKNLPHDSEYLTWILIILCEHYRTGDEIIIDYLLNLKKPIDLLFTSYGNHNVTPLMLFIHLYSNSKCQILLDDYLEKISSTSVLLQCDRWNRSYLTHLLCGQCEHQIEDNETACPHASMMLSRFSMLDQLGNRLDTPMKTILTSSYCFPLRMKLVKCYLDNHSSYEILLDEFFLHFPPKFIPNYQDDLKCMIHNRDLTSTLISQLKLFKDDNATIRFLLKQGARIQSNNTEIQPIIFNYLMNIRSIIPFVLLDYSFYIDISFEQWLVRPNPRMNMYICRVLQCGYPSEFRAKFDQFKTHLTGQTVKEIEKFVDVKNVAPLSRLCLQKLRSSLKDLGDETIEQLTSHLPSHLKHSIVHYGYDQCQPYFRTVVSLL